MTTVILACITLTFIIYRFIVRPILHALGAI